MTENNLNFVVK